ncbi:hypothetical protein CAPTEDRAFT_212929 [Capitella teleta]|uniref:Uncharacterized protein n=1 Tax=Capitella teleta TaxID=283909 RepID=R7VFL3_CAPTE|nr:hypothetical protein CAPTEDRAFT_212929 [Capitella teleta]|eukprot:ELU17362.1 hypothetical protein CAPTEDRAFT_212929 [Capitella teleta]
MSKEHIARRELCARVTELQEFEDLWPDSLPGGTVGILVGCNSALIEPLQVISSQDSSLHAVRYQHGWVVQGATGQCRKNIACNRMVTREVIKEVMTPVQCGKLLEADFNDQSPRHPDERGYSVDDRRILSAVKDGIKFRDGHYEVPLLIRNRASSIGDCENLMKDIVATFEAKGFRLTKFVSNKLQCCPTALSNEQTTPQHRSERPTECYTMAQLRNKTERCVLLCMVVCRIKNPWDLSIRVGGNPGPGPSVLAPVSHEWIGWSRKTPITHSLVSNNRAVLNRIEPGKRAKEVRRFNLDLDDLPITRALGVLWDTEGDNFGFHRLCSEGVGWDDSLSTEHRVAWENGFPHCMCYVATMKDLYTCSVTPAQAAMALLLICVASILKEK